ncbi:MAG: hypothetical protein ISS56_09455 [Anaerolineae bacterium]|nr:hypothetical protein [Anaerolineae bacterium]
MSEQKLKPKQVFLFYVLWILSAILCVLDALSLRSAITAVAAAIANAVPIEVQIERQWHLRWTVGAVDKFALAILGIAAVLGIIALDGVYRGAVFKGSIKKRFATVTAIQAGVLIVSQLAVWIVSLTL